MIENYLELANAIILQAVKDYRKALKDISINPKNRAAKRELREIEKFFRSSYCKSLTNLDTEVLIQRLRQEVFK